MIMTSKQLEEKLQEIKPIISSKFFVRKIGYFGSYATGNQSLQSDIDILVELSQPLGWEFFDLQELLEKELKCKIDLVTVEALKKQLKKIILKQVRFV